MTEVRPSRAAAAVALLVSALCAALFVVEPMYAPLARMVAGESELPLYGGLQITWLPPPNADLDRIVGELRARPGARVVDKGGALLIEVAGLDESSASDAASLMTGGPFEMREVIDDNPELGTEAKKRGLAIDVDRFVGYTGERGHSVTFVKAGSRQQLELGLAGWQPPAGTAIAYEYVATGLRGSFEWHAYLVGDRSVLPPSPVSSVVATLDQWSAPVVIIDFTPEATAAFGDVSAAMVGRKLAILVGGQVRSAPIINGAIRGGRASIAMGGADRGKQLAERDALAAAIRAGGLPAGGTVQSSTYIPAIASTLWLARIASALIFGAFAGLATALLVRIVKPRRAVPGIGVGGTRIGALIVTLVVPLAFVVLAPHVFLPFQTSAELDSSLDLSDHPTVLMLGLAPLVEAFAIVELLALIARPWRALRHGGPEGRRKLATGVVAFAIVLSLVQGWFLSRTLQNWTGPGDFYIEAGFWPRATTALATACGTLMFACAAAVIHARGHGSGYGIVLVAMWLTRMYYFADRTDGVHAGTVAACIVGLVAVGLTVSMVSRWRIGARGAAPAAGVIAVQATDAVRLVTGVLFAFGVSGVMPDELFTLERGGTRLLLVGALFAVGLTWLWARPSLTARYAARAGLAAETWRGWAGNAAVAVVVTVLILWVFVMSGRYGTFSTVVDVLYAPLVVATVLDIVADIRGRTKGMANVWVVQQVQHVPLVEEVLAGAGIVHHISCTRTRVLLAWFGAFVPMNVYVAAADEQRAAHLIRSVFDESVPPPTVGEAFS